VNEALDRPVWAAVVVNYEAGELLAACIRSIEADASAGAPVIVVVDNGSTDGSVEPLRGDATVTIVDPGSNLGYAGAANLGIARTTADVVAVCNADIQVSPGTAGAMVRRLSDEPDLAAVGPMIRDVDRTHYPSARRVPSVGDAVGHGIFGLVKPDNRYTRRYRELDADPTRARDVDWVSGAAVWLRRSALDAIGGWDDGYFMYVEDVDLCWRLRGAGWRVAYEPGGEVTHVHGASTARHPYRMIAAHHRSLLRFAGKRWHGWRRVLLVPAAAYLSARACLAMLVHGVRPRSGTARGSR
jgi:N-acetylglucosaminyl-diphospho-decaprenol L-rhamnosyltransferase